MQPRRPEKEVLHGPWPGPTPNTDQVTLDELREEFGTQWRIWRSLDQGKVPGEWCARRTTEDRGSPRALSADTANDLRDRLREESER